MEYSASDLTQRERYKVLTSFVLPRPIAWVTSLGPDGVVNAAPFSFFNVFCEDPPLCMFAVNRRPDGREKDTMVNIQRLGEFVVNQTDEPLARARLRGLLASEADVEVVAEAGEGAAALRASYDELESRIAAIAAASARAEPSCGRR